MTRSTRSILRERKQANGKQWEQRFPKVLEHIWIPYREILRVLLMAGLITRSELPRDVQISCIVCLRTWRKLDILPRRPREQKTWRVSPSNAHVGNGQEKVV